MGDRYAATGAITAVTASPGDSCLGTIGTTSARGRAYDLAVSTGGTPADNVLEWLLRRYDTSAGTATGVTPEQLDSGAPAALITANEQYTVEPTVISATELIDIDVNQRATYRWVAAPGGEIVIPATATTGIFVTPISSGYSGIARATLHWSE